MWKVVVIALLSVLLPLPDGDRVAEAQIAGVPSTDWCKFSHCTDIYYFDGIKLCSINFPFDYQCWNNIWYILVAATATSTYADNAGCYGPTFAIDGYSDTTSCRFFHSKATVPYPFVVGTLRAAKSVTSVTFKSRCDANGWGHTQFTLVVRYALNHLWYLYVKQYTY